MHILAQYNALLENPDMDFTPKTYIFAAKAAPRAIIWQSRSSR